MTSPTRRWNVIPREAGKRLRPSARSAGAARSMYESKSCFDAKIYLASIWIGAAGSMTRTTLADEAPA